MGRQQQSTGAEDKPVQRLRGLAWPLIALLVVIAAVSIWAAVEAGAAYLDLARYGPVSEDFEQVTPLVGVLHLLALPTGLLFIVWFHRAYRNLARYGYRLRHRPTIAIWSWFIPVGNLFAPKQIANEIWRACTVTASPDDEVEAWKLHPVDRSVHGWWGLWIFASLGFPIAFFLLPETYGALIEIQPELQPSRSQATFAQFLLSCSCLAYGGAALLAAHYVRQITRRQRTFLLPHETVVDEPEMFEEVPIPQAFDPFE